VAFDANRRPTCWIERGQAHPFFPEGDRRKVRLSANAAAEDMDRTCAAFAPIKRAQETLSPTPSALQGCLDHKEQRPPRTLQ